MYIFNFLLAVQRAWKPGHLQGFCLPLKIRYEIQTNQCFLLKKTLHCQDQFLSINLKIHTKHYRVQNINFNYFEHIHFENSYKSCESTFKLKKIIYNQKLYYHCYRFVFLKTHFNMIINFGLPKQLRITLSKCIQ